MAKLRNKSDSIIFLAEKEAAQRSQLLFVFFNKLKESGRARLLYHPSYPSYSVFFEPYRPGHVCDSMYLQNEKLKYTVKHSH